MEKMTGFICREGFAEVPTKQGVLRGYQKNDVYAFLGVQYGTAGRFLKAAEPEPWEGVKTALDYGFVCPTISKLTNVNDHTMWHRFWLTDEDCLNLNLWTTSLDRNAKKPVMVWLHGGGYVAGNASDFLCFEGDSQAKYGDVVTITVNHRLNVLGCLDLSEYGEEFSGSGNRIMQDVVLALRWIHDNIENFGGDPDNVLIYGHSGGGGKVTTLMQMPSADGLYHKAIVESGIIRFTGPVEGAAMRITKEKALSMTHTLLDHVGSLDKLRTMPTEDLMQACRECFGRNMQWTPVPGSDDYPGDFGQTGGFRPETKNVYTMIGSALCEFPRYRTGRDKASLTEEEKLQILRTQYGDYAEEVKSTFEECFPGINSYYAVGMDETNFRPMSVEFCKWRSAMGAAPAYNYQLVYEMPYDGGTMSFHGTELPMIYHNADLSGIIQSDRTESLQDEIFYAWMSFAHTGDPNHPKLPEKWLPCTEDEPATFLFGNTSCCRVGHDAKLMELMKVAAPPLPRRE